MVRNKSFNVCIVLMTVLFLPVSIANANKLTVAYLHRACQLANEFLLNKAPRLTTDGGWCLGYITGYTQAAGDAVFLIKKDRTLREAFKRDGLIYCINKDTTYQSQIKAVIDFIEKDKKKLKKQTVEDIIKQALQQAYPCKNK